MDRRRRRHAHRAGHAGHRPGRLIPSRAGAISSLHAVVAIAITLLVLPLAEVLQDVDPGESLGSVLPDEAGQFVAFFLSVAVTARFWLVHHRVVEGVGAYDSARSGRQLPARAAGRGVYVGTITVSSASLGAISILVWRRPALRRHADEPAPTPWPSLVTTGIRVVALLLGTLVRQVNYGAMLLLLTGPVEGWLRRRERAR